MLCVMNAGERTIEEFKALGLANHGSVTIGSNLWFTFSAQAGLQFVRTWDFAENGMVEFKLAEVPYPF